MQSILLDRTTWDFVVDADGNLAVCSEPYSVLQDVACALRTWLGECWYDQSLGMPFSTRIFNGPQPVSIMKTQAEEIAMTVPGVASAQCVVLGPKSTRSIGGVIIITLTSDGGTQVVNF